jgi:hypothetical protein
MNAAEGFVKTLHNAGVDTFPAFPDRRKHPMADGCAVRGAT